jgi:host factor-I protein
MALSDPDFNSSPIRSADVRKPTDRPQGLQETFLSHVLRKRVPLTVFLVSGVKLQGVVTAFDNFALLLRRGADSQLVYKHAISTIAPIAPIQLYEQVDRTGEPEDENPPKPAPRRPLVEIRRR